MSMPRISIVFGVLLILLGVGTYGAALAGMTESKASATALIPAFFGLALVACGAVAAAKPDLRKHVMHAAAAIGLLGHLGGAGKAIPTIVKDSASISKLAVIAQLTMALLCGVFVVLCVKSFIDARKARAAA